MNLTIKTFILKIIVLSVILFSGGMILFQTILKAYAVRLFPLQLLLIASLTAITHIRLIKASQKNIRQFNAAFMLAVTIKLLVYLFFLLTCLLVDHSNVLSFILSFFVLYIIFTVFEVKEALNFLKK